MSMLRPDKPPIHDAVRLIDGENIPAKDAAILFAHVNKLGNLTLPLPDVSLG
jgi:hypothetical protein